MIKPTLGFIGLGAMGKPMALNLLKGNYPLLVHNRSRTPVDELLTAGAQDGVSPRILAEQAEVVLLCLPDSPDVEAVMEGPDGVLAGLNAGKVLVDMSTISPVVARELAGRVEALGSDMLDAPVRAAMWAPARGPFPSW